MNPQKQWLFEAPFSRSATLDRSLETGFTSESEWLFEALPALPAVPPLLHTERTSVGLTLYTQIPLGGESPASPTTGIFIPQNYRATPQVDIILYLHGHHRSPVIKGKQPAPGYYPVTLSIHQYWNAAFYPYFAFREGVTASNKNVILVAPTLGPRSQAGRLVKPGGFDAYLDQIMAALNAYGSHQYLKQPPSIKNIILACHSGGGYPMRQIALSKAVYAPRIKECWGFDCTYNTGDDTQWARWAKSNPFSRLFIYSIANSPTARLATSLQTQARQQKLSNVLVSKSSTGNHNKVPIAYWESRIKAAPFLQNR